MFENLHHVIRAQEGDREAFGALVEGNWNGLVAFARVVLAGREDAEDAVQEALHTAWTRLPTLREPGAFPAWVRRIVHRCCLARLRRASRWTLVPLIDDLDAADADFRVTGDGRQTSGDTSHDSTEPPNQTTGDIARALAALSPRQRAVIFLGEIEGWHDDEIAIALGLKRPTIRIHRARARAKLKQLFREETP